MKNIFLINLNNMIESGGGAAAAAGERSPSPPRIKRGASGSLSPHSTEKRSKVSESSPKDMAFVVRVLGNIPALGWWTDEQRQEAAKTTIEHLREKELSITQKNICASILPMDRHSPDFGPIVFSPVRLLDKEVVSIIEGNKDLQTAYQKYRRAKEPIPPEKRAQQYLNAYDQNRTRDTLGEWVQSIFKRAAPYK